MLTLLERRTGTTTTTVVATDRADGDVHPGRVEPHLLRSRQLAATGRTWTMIDQAHGVTVHEIHDAGAPPERDGRSLPGPADVLVAPGPGATVAVWAADCAPVVLVGDRGALVAVHAGWRGLACGVLDVAVGALTRAGEDVAAAVLGPVIHPCCYPFGARELAAVAAGVGVSPGAVTGRSRDGARALDVPAAVAAGLRRTGVELDVVGPCTGCDARWYSHRRRGETGRHAVVAWSVP